MVRKNFSGFFFAAVFLVSFTCFATWSYIEDNYVALPYYGNGKAINLSEVERKKFSAIAEFSFINAQGKVIDQNFVKNKVWIADFFFIRCGSICPKMSNNLQQVQNEFLQNDDVRIISFTCDPENDNAEQLARYAKAYQANQNKWQFATGDKTKLYAFARKRLNITATDGDGGANDFIHSQNLVLIDKKGFIRGYYNGTDKQSIKQLIIDIKKLL